MSKSLRGHLLTAVFTVGFASGVAAPALAETLADAISLAYETNPTLQAQRATQRALDETYVQARSGWRPTLSLQGSDNFLTIATPRAARGPVIDTNGDGIPDTTIPATGSGIRRTNSGTVGFSLSQPIWTGGRVAAAVSAAEADVLAGRETLRRIEAQVILTVVQAYVDVRRDQDSVRIRQENVSVLQKQLEESKARFDVGEITRTDVAQSQSRLAAARALLQSAIGQLAISRANYAAVVGQNPGELAPEPSLAFLLPGSADDAFAIAEKYSPLLRAQQYAEQASRARVAGARAERMPTVSARASLGFTGTVEPFDSGRWSRNITGGANVTIPLFTGGLTTSRIRQSVERNNTDRINIETQRRAVLQSVTQSWNQWVAARSNIDSTAESVRAAEIAAEGTRQEQKVGLRTTLEVLNAEQELRNDELTVAAARHDAFLAAASVLSSMGRLEARELIPSITQYEPRNNFRKLRISWGWTPWEEPIGVIDSLLSVPARPGIVPYASEPPIGPGLQPAPAAPAAPAKK